MVKLLENGVSLAPFLVKCYEMVDDETTNDLISWTQSNDSFIIWDESKFSSQLLPKYFKHNNFASFVRQLNIYGFRKVDSDRWEFANESFVKGQRHLLKDIPRRKHPQSLNPRKRSTQKETEPVVESEADNINALCKEVEDLKTDKNALTQELIKLRQHQQLSQRKLILLGEQIKCMEKNQQQMLSFIVMAMQRPEFLMQFLQPKENTWCMAETVENKISELKDCGEPTPSDKMIVRYQPPAHEDVVQVSKSGDLMDEDFSFDEMEDFVFDLDLLLEPAGDGIGSTENQEQLVLPDIPENDILLERLLLSTPTDKEQFMELETEDCIDSRIQIGCESQPKDANISQTDDC